VDLVVRVTVDPSLRIATNYLNFMMNLMYLFDLFDLFVFIYIVVGDNNSIFWGGGGVE